MYRLISAKKNHERGTEPATKLPNCTHPRCANAVMAYGESTKVRISCKQLYLHIGVSKAHRPRSKTVLRPLCWRFFALCFVLLSVLNVCSTWATMLWKSCIAARFFCADRGHLTPNLLQRPFQSQNRQEIRGFNIEKTVRRLGKKESVRSNRSNPCRG